MGNQLRWADLALFQHQWYLQESQRKRKSSKQEKQEGSSDRKEDNVNGGQEEFDRSRYRVRILEALLICAY